ncbi:hypothetical protein ANN_10392 [Periplaneta americana]|uniref:Tc1-like transposase DDE domain-containing protein n=1 Tax=Periplaneta americana TaxID=6978 RepID=A0ABQ8TNV6_PERAM|nr:hypothetical protein ANN_10392 [Periplaneta americana]
MTTGICSSLHIIIATYGALAHVAMTSMLEGRFLKHRRNRGSEHRLLNRDRGLNPYAISKTKSRRGLRRNRAGQTINAVRYIQTLLKFRRALREKRPEKKVILQDDNVRPHIARITMEKIRTVGWETLRYPPYSPDLAPSDYHLFGSLKEQLQDQRYVNVFRKLERTSTARKFSNLQNGGKNVCKEMEAMLKSDRKVCSLRFKSPRIPKVMLGNFRSWTPDSFHRHYHLHFIQTLNNLDVDTAS